MAFARVGFGFYYPFRHVLAFENDFLIVPFAFDFHGDAQKYEDELVG